VTSRTLPGLAVVSSYRREWLPRDVVAGLVLTALLVPQGMAYAELAGLPAITGLYTSIVCLVAYALFGPSRILVLGPDSSLGPMIAATILPLVAAGDPDRAVALASVLAILVGLVTAGAGIARLGFVADLISRPTIIGYMNGLALTILVGQLPKLFGFSVDGNGFRAELAGFLRGVADGETVGAALAVGAAGLVLIVTLQHWAPRVPGVLLAVVLSIAAAAVLDLADHGVSVVGVLPQGFPPFTVPDVRLADLGPLVGGALGIALVALTDTISTASSFAARSGEEVDGQREMIGIGAANLAAGLFQGFPVSTSGSRTAVAERAGAKTQVTGLVGAVAIVLILLLFPGVLRDLPQPILAAVVIAASLSLADLRGTVRLYRMRRAEFLLSLAAFLGVVLLGVLPGIALAIALSIGNVFRRAWWPYQTVLGRVPGLPGFHDVRSYPDAEVPPGCVIFRFDAPLFFANADRSLDRRGSSSPRSRSPTSTPRRPTCSAISTRT
jgi:high affinity sulfate transporter 1